VLTGQDTLQAPDSFDIPKSADIPIVAKLAKNAEKEKISTMNGEELKKHKK